MTNLFISDLYTPLQYFTPFIVHWKVIDQFPVAIKCKSCIVQSQVTTKKKNHGFDIPPVIEIQRYFGFRLNFTLVSIQASIQFLHWSFIFFLRLTKLQAHSAYLLLLFRSVLFQFYLCLVINVICKRCWQIGFAVDVLYYMYICVWMCLSLSVCVCDGAQCFSSAVFH